MSGDVLPEPDDIELREDGGELVLFGEGFVDGVLGLLVVLVDVLCVDSDIELGYLCPCEFIHDVDGKVDLIVE